ncbi:hypothetical protein [Methylomonas sp. HYX-M1]|uniref:hypothetical protein n=1 Tax=Methylomonas sp. HYX-M1 TaxID=3139307 RepID=UPI00345BF239
MPHDQLTLDFKILRFSIRFIAIFGIFGPPLGITLANVIYLISQKQTLAFSYNELLISYFEIGLTVLLSGLSILSINLFRYRIRKIYLTRRSNTLISAIVLSIFFLGFFIQNFMAHGYVSRILLFSTFLAPISGAILGFYTAAKS